MRDEARVETDEAIWAFYLSEHRDPLEELGRAGAGARTAAA